MKVVGFRHRTIKFDNGNDVSGYDIFLEEKRDAVQGTATEKIFLSDAKADRTSFKPEIGMEVEIVWSRWGNNKVDKVIPCK